MKTFKQFIKEEPLNEASNSDIEEIMPILTGTFKFTQKNFKQPTGNDLRILVSGKAESVQGRLEILNKIHAEIAKKGFEGWVFNSVYKRLEKNKAKIYIKPASMQGQNSSGTCGEYAFVDILDYMLDKIEELDELDNLTVTFKGKNKSISYNNIVSVYHVGQMTKGRKKADVMLEDDKGRKIPISLKQEDSQEWESSESLLGKSAGELLRNVLKDPKSGVKLEKRKDGQYHLKPEVSIKLGKKLTNDVMFGSDIQKDGGAIVVKSFSGWEVECKKNDWKGADFVWNPEKNEITINCLLVANKVSDIPEYAKPYLIIRNASARPANWFEKGARGIRPSVYYSARLSKNTYVVKGELK